jgi:hypothetical protein
MAEITFINRGANKIDVERNGRPFAQLWTFTDKSYEWHPWHLKTVSGLYKTFGGGAYQSRKAKKVAGFDAMAFAKHLGE